MEEMLALRDRENTGGQEWMGICLEEVHEHSLECFGG